jgi:hypothetical protein
MCLLGFQGTRNTEGNGGKSIDKSSRLHNDVTLQMGNPKGIVNLQVTSACRCGICLFPRIVFCTVSGNGNTVRQSPHAESCICKQWTRNTTLLAVASRLFSGPWFNPIDASHSSPESPVSPVCLHLFIIPAIISHDVKKRDKDSPLIFLTCFPRTIEMGMDTFL